jgi:hypothetical protein
MKVKMLLWINYAQNNIIEFLFHINLGTSLDENFKKCEIVKKNSQNLIYSF